MRYERAVQKLRILADACQHTVNWPPGEPFLREAYVFGEVLEGTDPIDHLKVALVLNLPPEEVPWDSHPRGADWLVDTLRLNKGGYAYWWRSRHDPVWNHHIRGPVRFWSLAGPDEEVLTALSERRFDDLPRITADPAEVQAQTTTARDTALAHLRNVHKTTGNGTGAANTAATTATPRTTCGKPSTATWTSWTRLPTVRSELQSPEMPQNPSPVGCPSL
jgi:hypothetical protein